MQVAQNLKELRVSVLDTQAIHATQEDVRHTVARGLDTSNTSSLL